MEVQGPQKIVDNTTGVSTAVPEEHRVNDMYRKGNGKAKLGADEVQMIRRASNKLTHQTAGFNHQGNFRHPILQLTRDLHGYGVHHDNQMLLWHMMREYVPTLDAAIENRRAVEGGVVIEAEDDGLEDDLREFWRSVPVGTLGSNASFNGGDFYLSMLANAADEYGLGVGEQLMEPGGRGIRRLIVPNMRTISSMDLNQDGIYEIYQNDVDDLERNANEDDFTRLDNRENVNLLAFRASTETEWPYPLAWSLKQTAESFLRIVDATINGWWRFGDPSLHFNLEYDAETDVNTTTVQQGDDDTAQDQSVEVPEALVFLQNGMAQVMDARREGKVSDMYSYVDGGELNQEVIGQIDSTLMEYVEEHKSQIGAEIVQQSDTPSWMYPAITQSGDGLGSKRSLAMAKIADDAADMRNELKREIARDVLDNFLIARGDSRFVGEYSLTFRKPGIVSQQMEAEADLKQAKADERAAKVAGLAFNPEGERRFDGEAGDYLERHSNVYASEE